MLRTMISNAENNIHVDFKQWENYKKIYRICKAKRSLQFQDGWIEWMNAWMNLSISLCRRLKLKTQCLFVLISLIILWCNAWLVWGILSRNHTADMLYTQDRIIQNMLWWIGWDNFIRSYMNKSIADIINIISWEGGKQEN